MLYVGLVLLVLTEPGDNQMRAGLGENGARRGRDAQSQTGETDVRQADDAQQDIEEIVIIFDFREHDAREVPGSIAVVDTLLIADQGGEHLQDIWHAIPNLNWAGGTSRPRYFQIRGIGERDEYQGAPNSSVGFIIDDIDLSGLGMAADLFDLAQIEVLRGPQGTRYGANALAGIIYLQSQAPSDTFTHGFEAGLSNDAMWTLGAYSSGPLTSSGSLLYRLALRQQRANGFRRNSFLGRSATNGRDELTGRGKLRWQAHQALQADLTLLYASLDNGYDAWTLDNNGFTTLTDQPGEDSQQTLGSAVKLTWSAAATFDVVAIASVAHTDHRHAYDGDWANPEFWAARQCVDDYDSDNDGLTDDLVACQYDYWWDKRGHRRTLSGEVRLVSSEAGRLFAERTDWLVGAYAMQLDEHNDLDSTYNGSPDVLLVSDYRAQNGALFAEANTLLAQATQLQVGARVEQRESRYQDDGGDAFDPSETMWGGHLALSYSFAEPLSTYARLARGYKAGGFNMGIPDNLRRLRRYSTETLYNYELGVKGRWLRGRLRANLALFTMDRRDQQVEASAQDPDNPQRFFLYTANAASATSYGAELDVRWHPVVGVMLYGSLGLLEASFDRYVYVDAEGATVDRSGRDVAHAPNYQGTLGATLRHSLGWVANINASATDAFFYSDSHNSRSHPYALINAQLGYQTDGWSLMLWGRNLTDARYGVRGFYFGNEPDRGWVPAAYVRYGDPRQFGVKLRYDYE